MPKTYKHLSAEERDIIAVLKSKGHSLRHIAKVLKRSPSTVSRELKRNAAPVYTGYYLAHKAQQRADKRKHQSHRRQRLKNDFIRGYVQKHIRLGWSPELIDRWQAEHRTSRAIHQPRGHLSMDLQGGHASDCLFGASPSPT